MREFMIGLFNDNCVIVKGGSFSLIAGDHLMIYAGKSGDGKPLAAFHCDKWTYIHEIQPAMKEPDQTEHLKKYFGAPR